MSWIIFLFNCFWSGHDWESDEGSLCEKSGMVEYELTCKKCGRKYE